MKSEIQDLFDQESNDKLSNNGLEAKSFGCSNRGCYKIPAD